MLALSRGGLASSECDENRDDRRDNGKQDDPREDVDEGHGTISQCSNPIPLLSPALPADIHVGRLCVLHHPIFDGAGRAGVWSSLALCTLSLDVVRKVLLELLASFLGRELIGSQVDRLSRLARFPLTCALRKPAG
jgi:hypothetical protein